MQTIDEGNAYFRAADVSAKHIPLSFESAKAKEHRLMYKCSTWNGLRLAELHTTFQSTLDDPRK